MNMQRPGDTSWYKPVPSNSPIARLLTEHDTGHNAFITHLDKSRILLKVIVFVPVFILNIAFASLFAWRLLSGKERYIPFAGDMVRIPLTQKVETTWYWTIINIAIDTTLYKTIWPLLWSFITGHLWLRIRYGFRETEIIFRKASGSRLATIRRLPEQQFQKAFQDSLYRAIDKNLVYGNVGYNTLSDFWFCDYTAPMEAYKLVESGEVDEHTWDLSVWMKNDEGTWLVWEVWRLHQQSTGERAQELLKAKLESVGKAHLITEWQALLTRSATDGVMQSNTLAAASDLFAREGIDFEELGREVMREAGLA